MFVELSVSSVIAALIATLVALLVSLRSRSKAQRKGGGRSRVYRTGHKNTIVKICEKGEKCTKRYVSKGQKTSH